MDRSLPLHTNVAKTCCQMLVCLLAVTFSAVTALDAVAANDNSHTGHSHASLPGAAPVTAGAARLGKVDFSVSCQAAVQPRFDRAVALLHSFEYDIARAAFEQVIDQDRQCAIAFWGVAMSYLHPLWSEPTDGDRESGKAAALAARRIGSRSARERGFIGAVNAYYSGSPSHAARMAAYAEAMQQLFTARPRDVEVAAFHALALIAMANPTDRSYRNQLQAGQILEPFVDQYPDHPGLTHYIIHGYDNPELAPRALQAAQRYARIAPDSAHALHMPSHIFERLGMWQDSIRMNLRSTQAAREYASALQLPGHWDEELHGLDFLLYAYLQSGDLEHAAQVRDYIGSITAVYPENFKVAYVLAAAPARYALETRDWRAAAALQPGHDYFPWSSFSWQQAITHFANGYGKARLGDIAGAREKQLLLEQLAAKPQGLSDYRIERLVINALTLDAWIRLAQGQNDAALEIMREATAREAAMLIPDGQLIPAAENLGDMYLELGRAQAALESFESSLARNRNRRAAIVGAIAAAQALKDAPRVDRYTAMLKTLSADAPSP